MTGAAVDLIDFCARYVYHIWHRAMDKTTLYLDSDDYRRLKRIAFRRRVAPAVLVREAIAAYVARHDVVRTASSVGATASGRSDLAERAEEFLAGFGTPR